MIANIDFIYDTSLDESGKADFIAGHLADAGFPAPAAGVYEMRNPAFLSDVFVFAGKEPAGTPLTGKVPYVKLDCDNRIEEIGVDLAERAGFTDYGTLVASGAVSEATPVRRAIFSAIGDEYWRFLAGRRKTDDNLA